jgi:hypothetical protein
MIDKRPEADRLLVAEIWGEARHHARWRELTGDEEAAAPYSAIYAHQGNGVS